MGVGRGTLCYAVERIEDKVCVVFRRELPPHGHPSCGQSLIIVPSSPRCIRKRVPPIGVALHSCPRAISPRRVRASQALTGTQKRSSTGSRILEMRSCRFSTARLKTNEPMLRIASGQARRNVAATVCSSTPRGR
jgi:hypothetical protein